MKTNLEFEKRQQPFIRPRLQQQRQEAFSAPPEARINSLKPLPANARQMSSMARPFQISYTNDHFRVALACLREILPKEMALLDQLDGAVTLIEGPISSESAGLTNVRFSTNHIVSVLPTSKITKKGKEPEDSYIDGGFIYDHEMTSDTPLTITPNNISTTIDIDQIFEYHKAQEADFISRGSNLYDVPFQVARHFTVTLAHELLGHVFNAFANTEQSFIYNSIHGMMEETEGSDGHERGNLDGEFANAIEAKANKAFGKVNKKEYTNEFWQKPK